MGRFRDSMDDGGDAAIDMSPLIDCVFILLIFFIVTTVFVEESGVQVERPEPAASAAPQDESTSCVFTLTAEGQIFFEGRECGLHGVQPNVARRLQKEQVPVIIQAARNSRAGRLVEIIDHARQAGAEEVSVAAGGGQG